MGGTFVFMLSRRVFKEKVFTYLDKHPKYNIVKSISKGINKISLPGLSLIIACPFTPSFVINIGSGLSNIKYDNWKILYDIFYCICRNKCKRSIS